MNLENLETIAELVGGFGFRVHGVPQLNVPTGTGAPPCVVARRVAARPLRT